MFLCDGWLILGQVVEDLQLPMVKINYLIARSKCTELKSALHNGHICVRIMQLREFRIFNAFLTTVLWYNIMNDWLEQKSQENTQKKAKKKVRLGFGRDLNLDPSKMLNLRDRCLSPLRHWGLCKNSKYFINLYKAKNRSNFNWPSRPSKAKRGQEGKTP